MNTERAQVGCGFWLLWVLASTVGYALGYVMAIVVALFVNLAIPGVGYAASSVFGAVIGASVGTALWLILRRQVSRAGWWVLASTVSGAVYMVVVEAVAGGGAAYMAVVGAGGLAVLGALLGTGQWLILRRQVSRAGWWVLASTVGIAASLSVFEAMDLAVADLGALGRAVGGPVVVGRVVGLAVEGAGGLAVGGAYGAITGVVLVWLLRQPVAEGSIHPRKLAISERFHKPKAAPGLGVDTTMNRKPLIIKIFALGLLALLCLSVVGFWYFSGNKDRTGMTMRVLGEIVESPMGETALLEPIFVKPFPTFGVYLRGSHAIVLRDENGEELARYPFKPDRITGTGPGGPILIKERVPYVEGTSQLEIEGPSRVIGSIRAGLSPPTVEMVSPNGGETLNQWPITIRWEASDPDGDEMAFIVDFSPDDGKTWVNWNWGIVEGENQLHVEKFSRHNLETHQGRFRVWVSDGINTSYDDSDGSFIVPRGNEPYAEIIFPPDADIFQGGHLVWLQGFGTDPDDGRLGGTSLTWESNIDGVLGNGDELPLTTLSEGAHEIELIATDSDGNSESVSIEILIDDTAPSLDLSALPSLTERACAVVEIFADDVGGSGLSAVEYSLDAGETWTSISPDELPFEFIVPGVEQVYLVVRAIDNADNLTADDRRYYFERECNDADLSGDK